MSWREFYENECGKIVGSWYVVPTYKRMGYGRTEHRLNPTAPMARLTRRLKDYLTVAGIKNVKGLGTHTMRRTAAIGLLDSGADIGLVSYLLGHADTRMAEIYIDRPNRVNDLAAAMKNWKH